RSLVPDVTIRPGDGYVVCIGRFAVCETPTPRSLLRAKAEKAMRETKPRARNGRWRTWTTGWLPPYRTSPVAVPERTPVVNAEQPIPLRVALGQHEVTRDDLKKQITTAAFAFRGYDSSNLGRGPELLEHAVYGSYVRAMLDQASVVAGDVLKAKVDLAARVQ